MLNFGTYNSIILCGYLGQDPTVKFLPSGIGIVNFSVAVKKYNRETKTNTDVLWFNCHSFDKVLVEQMPKWAHKGDPVQVRGEVDIREYTDKDNVRRTVVEVNVQDFTQMKSKSDSEDQGDRPAQVAAPAAKSNGAPAFESAITDEDVPF